MEQIIVTIEGCGIGPLKAGRDINAQGGYETLTFESKNFADLNGKSIAEFVFRNLNGANLLEVRTQNQLLGFYTLLHSSHDRLVLERES
jgi:hypothetical protein